MVYSHKYNNKMFALPFAKSIIKSLKPSSTILKIS